MTVKDITKELECIRNDNAVCMNIISSPEKSKEEKAECRKRLIENNHQKMHLESILVSIRYDPLL